MRAAALKNHVESNAISRNPRDSSPSAHSLARSVDFKHSPFAKLRPGGNQVADDGRMKRRVTAEANSDITSIPSIVLQLLVLIPSITGGSGFLHKPAGKSDGQLSSFAQTTSF